MIYCGKPRFFIFGVGDYTFTPWKVAVSSFYKIPHFIKVGPMDGALFGSPHAGGFCAALLYSR